MKKNFLFSTLLVLAVLFVFSFTTDNSCNSNKSISEQTEDAVSAQGIKFMKPNWEQALQEAKNQHKLIFLDAYASWCGPCKLLKRKTFTDKAAGEFFNKNFVNIAIDMEKGDGPALAEKFHIAAYPTLIFADENGRLIAYTEGFVNPAELISFGQHGLSKMVK